MQVAVLTYHSIDSSGSVISVTPQKFREQMEFLKRSQVAVLSLSQVVAALKGKSELPKNAVAITFDDGFRNFHQSAFPILRDLQIPATVFIVTGHCGGRNDWYGQMEGIPALELMDWEGISSIAQSGIDVGSHTRSHPDLSRCSAQQVEDELNHSSEMIRQRIGKAPSFFAYPYGIRSSVSDEIVRHNFEGACSVVMNFTTKDSDPFWLPRIDMYYFSRNDLFSRYGSGLFNSYIRVRAFLRSLRGAS